MQTIHRLPCRVWKYTFVLYMCTIGNCCRVWKYTFVLYTCMIIYLCYRVWKYTFVLYMCMIVNCCRVWQYTFVLYMCTIVNFYQISVIGYESHPPLGHSGPAAWVEIFRPCCSFRRNAIWNVRGHYLLVFYTLRLFIAGHKDSTAHWKWLYVIRSLNKFPEIENEIFSSAS